MYLRLNQSSLTPLIALLVGHTAIRVGLTGEAAIVKAYEFGVLAVSQTTQKFIIGGGALASNPGAQQGVMDFADGYFVPGSPPASPLGYMGKLTSDMQDEIGRYIDKRH